MKTALVFFLLGAVTVICVSQLYPHRTTLPVTETGSSLAAKARTTADEVKTQTRDAADRVKDTVNDKLEDWHLTPEDIKADLAKTGQVVRTKAHAAGETIADARAVTVIKAKYVLDRDLSAVDISVSATAGEIMLTGTVVSPELIGRAIELALATDGVRRVTSRLVVQSKSS